MPGIFTFRRLKKKTHKSCESYKYDNGNAKFEKNCLKNIAFKKQAKILSYRRSEKNREDMFMYRVFYVFFRRAAGGDFCLFVFSLLIVNTLKKISSCDDRPSTPT